MYINLPGIYSELIDGNLRLDSPADLPSVLVIGTAAEGVPGALWRVRDIAATGREFGRGSKLLEGIQEVRAGGGRNIIAMRLPGRKFIFRGVGSSDDAFTFVSGSDTGFTLKSGLSSDAVNTELRIGFTTVLLHATTPNLIEEAGKSAVDAALDLDPSRADAVRYLLEVANADGDVLFRTFEINEQGNQYWLDEYDLGGVISELSAYDLEVFGDGRLAENGGGDLVVPADVGTFVNEEFTALLSLSSTISIIENNSGYVYQLATTGENSGAMAVYESLHEQLSLLDFQPFDVVFVKDLELNIKDAIDMDESGDPRLDQLQSWSLTNFIPTKNSAFGDVLGYLAIKEIDFEKFYFWTFEDPAAGGFDPVTDVQFAPGEFVADLASAGLVAGDFVPVNFGHLLATYAFRSSTNHRMTHAVIGTSVPRSTSQRDVLRWLGKSPEFDFDVNTGEETVVTNGSGILGYKLIGGSDYYRSGAKYGGLYLSEDYSFMGPNIVMDENDEPVDLGKYLSVVAAFSSLRNDSPRGRRGYVGNLAGNYAGMIGSLELTDAPTNNVVAGAQMRYNISGDRLDEAVGFRIVLLRPSPEGPRIADAPTFATPGSDWTRVMTVRIVNDLLERIRSGGSPFVGKGLSAPQRLALEAQIEQILDNAISERNVLNNGSYEIRQSRAQRIQGEMDLYLDLGVVNELRRIRVKVSLS